MKGNTGNPLALTSLNHISLVCRSVEKSIEFYKNVLGFVPVRRPGSFNFNGAWLFSYGIGIHLLQSEDPEEMQKKTEINPKDNHISFQVICSVSLTKADCSVSAMDLTKFSTFDMKPWIYKEYEI
uniref:Lactoylglutathione lyase n=1 Tax=Solanum tuberosum TaxID=4113 RepID=M0ZIX7_SOLTU